MSIEEVAYTAGKMRTEWVYIDREIGANVYFMKFFGANRIRECAFPRADSRFAQPNIRFRHTFLFTFSKSEDVWLRTCLQRLNVGC